MMSHRVASGLEARKRNGWKVASKPGDPLTERQLQIYRYIRAHFRKHRRAPTRVQIQTAFEFKSPNAAQEVVMALVAKGALQHIPGRKGGLVPLAYTPPEQDGESHFTAHLPRNSALSW